MAEQAEIKVDETQVEEAKAEETKAKGRAPKEPAVLYEFESTRYPNLVIWNDGAGKPLAQFRPDPEAEPVGDPASGLVVRPGYFATDDPAVAARVAAAEGVKGANKAAKDLIAKVRGSK